MSVQHRDCGAWLSLLLQDRGVLQSLRRSACGSASAICGGGEGRATGTFRSSRPCRPPARPMALKLGFVAPRLLGKGGRHTGGRWHTTRPRLGLTDPAIVSPLGVNSRSAPAPCSRTHRHGAPRILPSFFSLGGSGNPPPNAPTWSAPHPAQAAMLRPGSRTAAAVRPSPPPPCRQLGDRAVCPSAHPTRAPSLHTLVKPVGCRLV